MLCSTLWVQAQRFTEFSKDPALTVEEMKSFLSTAPKDQQKNADDLLKTFTEYWNGTTIGNEEQSAFIEEANSLLHHKMRPFPHFKAYFDAYRAFTQSQYAEDLTIWIKMVEYHATHNVTQFSNKMQLYEDFFTQNLLNNETNVKWRVAGSAEKIGFDQVPYIDFVKIDLVGISPQDSITISNASGRFFPDKVIFQGKEGTIYWERAGLGHEVKAVLSKYEIDVRFSKISNENATFYYPKLFNYPLKGRVDDKTTTVSDPEKAMYPRFRSYNNNLTIKDLYPNVDYIGGFDIRGASIFGYASGDTLASITIRKKDRIIVRASSKSFLIHPDNLLSEDAKICIYIENDSIYHPAANFQYNNKTNELLISRPKLGVGRSPFFDSYHKLDITVESITWKTTEERIEFKPLIGNAASHSAYFESQNYYDESVMHEIQGVNVTNPLYTLWELFKSNSYQDITIEDVIAYFNKPPLDMKAMMIDFAARGFIEYDVNQNRIHYRSKISQYLNNQVKAKDFDYIKLESKTHYASLDLLTNELNITGCDFFVLSDPQIVNVYPMDEKVTVKKNRDMVFSGRIVAGLFDFVSHNCQFDYNRFQVEMNVIDSMIMYVEDKNGPQNMYGDYKLQRVRSRIEDLSGTLFIDVPGNKSGMTDYPDYSIFEARKGGKVYYDQPYVLNGVYTRDRFYYAVNQFTIKNLDNFVIDSMKFTGALISGGIFPDIPEPLTVQPDFSLGFRHNTAGLPMYGNKGGYQGVVDLSNRGLRGKGNIDYITSHTQSDSIVFYMDSTNGSANRHLVDEQMSGTEFPPASVNDAYLHWEPYQDQMFINTLKNPIDVFHEVKLVGNSKITPSGMYGTGIAKFHRADLTSNLFYFKHHELLSDTSNLRIYDIRKGDDVAFSTDNYHSHIDFKTRKGVFTSNGDASEVNFVKNEIKTRSSEFEWDPIDSTILRFKWDDPHKNIDIDNTPTRELVDMHSEGNELYASDPSIGYRFNAVNADFDFSSNIINAHGVRYINVGDAAIIPNHGDVIIHEKAVMEELHKSRILAGRENKYFELYNCNSRITTATRFYANGYYDFIEADKSVQTLYFDTVYYIKETFGQAKIPLDKKFQFSDQFGFDGRAELHSTQPFLSFFGGVAIQQQCDTIHHARMKILQQVDPNNIMLQVHDRTKDMDERKVVVAIASSNKTGRIYTCFGAAKDEFNDAEYIHVFGYITYDKETHEFKAASMEKLLDPTVPGNIITINTDNCVATGSGEIDMGAKLGRVDFVTNGTIINYMTADSAEMHLTTSIDFFFNDESMKSMNKALEASTSMNFVDVSNDEAYNLALYNILGKNEFEKYQKTLASGSQNKRLPDKLQVKFLFSDIYFQWDKDNSAFTSQTALPLIICGAKTVYKTVPGRIVIEKRGSRNRLYLYFEFDNQFYFFQFENNSVSGYSSDKNFNDAISNTKYKNKTLPTQNGQPSFSYKLGNRGQKLKFTKKYYQNIVQEENGENNDE